MAEEIVNAGYLRDPETHEIFLPQTDESLVTGLTNKIDTAINNKINSLDGNATATDTGTGANVITEVSETDGILSSKQKTITEGNKIDVTGASGSITIAHESITTTPTDNSSTVGEKETYVITDVTTDGYGHVTAYTKDKSTNLIAADIKAPVRMTDNSMWNFRKTGGSISIGEDSARFTSLKGKTLVWNQREVEAANYASGDIIPTDCSVSYSNGIATVTGSASQNASFALKTYSSTKCVVGHKYFACVTLKSNVQCSFYLNGSNGMINRIAAQESFTKKSFIYSNQYAEGYAPFTFYVVSPSAAWEIQLKYCFCIDLTLMFGAGNEPSTVEEFESLFPESYYPYNAGTLISNEAKEIESVGFNLWDEEWEVGYVNPSTGAKQNANDAIRSRNYINVLPSTSYYIKSPYASAGSRPAISFYDAGKNYISGNTESGTSRIFTTPSNARYIRFGCGTVSPVYNHDICINLSDESKNGTYEPYWKSSMPLNLNAIKVYSHNIWDEETELGIFDYSTGAPTSSSEAIRSKNFNACSPGASYYFKVPGSSSLRILWYNSNKGFISSQTSGNLNNTTQTAPSNAAYYKIGLSSAYGTTYNNDICINVSSSFNGQYEPHGILTIEGGLKGAGSVYDEIVGNKYIKRVGSVDLGTLTWYKTGSGSYSGTFYADINDRKTGINILCGHYTTVSLSANLPDKCITEYAANDTAVRVNDTAYTDAASFKTAMSGVYLYYELATPIEYELAEPIPNTYAVDDNGTEMLIPTGVNASGVPYSAPFVGTFEYSSNFKEAVLDLLQIKGGRAINIDANYEVSAKITDDLENDHPDDKLISAAQAWVELDERNVHADIVTAVTNGTIVVTENTITGSATPSTAPTRLGQQYIKTSSPRKVYIAVGTSSSSDWLQVGSE